ncbi:MAG: DUF1080 domain-containing protein [Phycisphaeraceae bacterium]|nr:DUF1080 domain-containing protein [Phycisphaeraceae bacterium]
MRWTVASVLVAVALVGTCLAVDTGRPRPHMYTTAEAAKQHDPDFIVQGEYRGEVRIGEDIEVFGVHMVAQGNDRFRVVRYEGGLPGDGWAPSEQAAEAGQENSRPTIDGRPPSFINEKLEHKPQRPGKRDVVETTRTDDRITADFGDWKVTWEEGGLAVTDSEDRALGRLARVDRKSPTLGQQPLEGAVVLFDGTNVDRWHNGRIVLDDLLFRGVTTRENFGAIYLHVEFRLPYMPRARGQGRANSGVYIQRRYEVQVLDSFGLDATRSGGGGIYNVHAPDVNMCRPPLTWETYDIYFMPPRYEENRKVANARMTVYQNGVLIHDDVEVPRQTGGGRPESPEPGPIYLQDHGEPVVYRNVWLVPLEAR